MTTSLRSLRILLAIVAGATMATPPGIARRDEAAMKRTPRVAPVHPRRGLRRWRWEVAPTCPQIRAVPNPLGGTPAPKSTRPPLRRASWSASTSSPNFRGPWTEEIVQAADVVTAMTRPAKPGRAPGKRYAGVDPRPPCTSFRVRSTLHVVPDVVGLGFRRHLPRRALRHRVALFAPGHRVQRPHDGRQQDIGAQQ